MKKLFAFCAAIALVALTFACQPQSQQTTPAVDTRVADEAALRKADEEWSKAAALRDLDKTVSYYADGAMVMPPNDAVTTSKDAIRKIWKGYFDSPDFGGGWKATRVEVANSGDLGYASGTWEFTWKDASGKPASDRGKFTEVWKKQSDGSWKCVADIWNSDLPLPAPAANK